MIQDFKNNKIICQGIGKRKSSLASVKIFNGKGQIFINGKELSEIPKILIQKSVILSPLTLLNSEQKYDALINVSGGGYSSQLEATLFALSKALSCLSEEYRDILKKNFFLENDCRIKERRKYGLKKARKAPQYSKR